MKTLKISAIVLGIIGLIYLIVIAILPSKVWIERSILVNASQEKVFDYLEDFRHFPEWAYWTEQDPSTYYDYEGPLKGVGTRINWSSERHGEDFVTWKIIETIPHSQIKVEVEIVEFAKPAIMEFNFSKERGLTKIDWDFQTDFYGHWKFFVPGMETELGPDFEKGLLKIKSILETI